MYIELVLLRGQKAPRKHTPLWNQRTIKLMSNGNAQFVFIRTLNEPGNQLTQHRQGYPTKL